MNRAGRNMLMVLSSVALLVTATPNTRAATTPFTLRWTSPGDDGATGRATSYDLRYSNLPITAANFTLATRILNLPAPSIAGATEMFEVSGVTDGTALYLAIKTSDDVGNWSEISNLLARPGQPTGIDPVAVVLWFSASRPNPARESVHWAYSAPTASRVQVDVFDATGRHVQAIADGVREAGSGELSWDLRGADGSRVGAGVYFVRARIGDIRWTKRLVVVR